MTTHLITLDAHEHANFLAEQRTDPITKEFLHAGMEIVICAREKLAFDASNWHGSCPRCGGTETLAEVPVTNLHHLGGTRPVDLNPLSPLELPQSPKQQPTQTYHPTSRPASTPTPKQRSFSTVGALIGFFVLAFLIFAVIRFSTNRNSSVAEQPPSTRVSPGEVQTGTTAPEINPSKTPTRKLQMESPSPTQTKTKSKQVGKSSLQGKIVFQCNIDGFQQICIMNADGSDQRQLTKIPSAAATYPSLSPDGKSVIYTSNQSGDHAIYEMEISTGSVKQLTEPGGDKAYPEMSPDGRYIAFTDVGSDKKNYIFVMNRDGSGLHQLIQGGMRSAWSPDGQRIAYICLTNGPQICVVDANGSNNRQISEIAGLNYRVAWSPDEKQFVFSVGKQEELNRKVCTINTDGSNYRCIFEDGDGVTPSFSPDGEWIVFTNSKINGNKVAAEIFIIRSDGTDVRQLTKNERTDWMAYWGR